MNFVFNELSLEKNEVDITGFRVGFERVMKMRQLLKRSQRELYCGRSITDNLPAKGTIYNIVEQWDANRKRALLGWLQKKGPFWEDIRKHGADDYLTYNDSIVTDSAVGEAAFLCQMGLDWRLVSLSTTVWDFSPISIIRHIENDKINIEVLNYWDIDQLKLALEEDTESINSWDDLKILTSSRFSGLSFSSVCFDYLQAYPFSSSQAQRIRMLLSILQKYKGCFDRSGQLTEEGHMIRTNYFMGDNALFSNSSDTERFKFEKELTFPHPELKNKTMFCPWHGKVRGRVPIRIHFSWPIRADEPLYVVYVGPKLTKR